MTYTVWRSSWPSMPDLRYFEICGADEVPLPSSSNDETIEPVLCYQCEDPEDDEVASYVLNAITFQSWELASQLVPPGLRLPR